MKDKNNTQLVKKTVIFLLIFSLGVFSGYWYVTHGQPKQQAVQEKNTPKAFLDEVYNKIKENYWDNISDEKLKDLFKQAQSKTNQASEAASLVLSALPPAGRSGLYTQKQEVALKNIVENRNPETGIVEPTISNKLIGTVLYVKFDKFSPTSLDEFVKPFDAHRDNEKVNSLILDMRGNIGGAIDSTAYFLGLFLGKNQYGFDFYKKGEYLPFKTTTDELPSLAKYKQIVILIDNNTQSSAEMMAASMKKYHIGVAVGVPTKGWGSVERVFPLENQISSSEKYSIFLVHSLTLRDDNQPIEGRGVDPDVNIKSPDWEEQLFNYFRNRELIGAVKKVL
ncbi:MAG: hypothetical protein G01um10147_823 [Microgenomates group bacterium Gr01-1014_7]|nr:MAG: hypothetical protein G01um10147_823 [Microgenomates group bacterium Gr01-1014_7]